MARFLNLLSIFFILSLSLLGAIVALQNLDQNLDQGQTLKAGEFREARKYKFIMQADCNLVLFRGNKTLWSSKTSRLDGPCSLMIQMNGNMVISNGAQDIFWCTCTTSSVDPDSYYFLRVQNDGNVVIYSAQKPAGFVHKAIWATNTANIPSY